MLLTRLWNGPTAVVGMDAYSAVTDDYDPWINAFTATIHKITVKHKGRGSCGRSSTAVMGRRDPPHWRLARAGVHGLSKNRGT